MTDHTFQVTLVIKGDTRDQAYSHLAIKLNDWFMQEWRDKTEPPYPAGSLLLWSTNEGGNGI